MITKIFVLCVFLAQASSNPLLQALAQTCPICQQNALKNPLAAALPMFLQQSPQYQPYPQGMMSENAWPTLGPVCPPKNQFCPCQPNKYYQQPTCPPNTRNSNNQANSDIINKLLSNPALKSILDPYTKLFNQNGAEVIKNGQCKNGTPNIINNYFIVPPELLLEDAKCIPKEDKSLKEDRRGRNGKKRRKLKQNSETREEQKSKSGPTDVVIELTPIKENSKSKGVQDEDNKLNEKLLDKEENKQLNKTENDQPIERKRRRRKKNRNPNIKVEVLHENDTKTNNPTETPSPTTTETNIAEKNILAATTEAHILEPKIVENMQNYENLKINKIDTESNKEHVKSIPLDLYSQVVDNMTPIFALKPNENIETTTSDIEADPVEQIQKQNRQDLSTEKPRSKNQNTFSQRNQINLDKNSRVEAVIADFKEKFPNIPENVVRDLIEHMARQIQNQNLGSPKYYSQYPRNYKQHLENNFNHDITLPLNKNKNDKRRNHHTKVNKYENTDAVRSTTEITKAKDLTEIIPTSTTMEKPTTIEITTQAMTLTEKSTIKPEIRTVTAEHVKEPPVETNTFKPFEKLRSIEKVSDDIFETYDNGKDKTPELGKEDIVPVFYVNGLYEYYPDFTADNQYFSDEDYYSYLQSEEDRYYYTTDKNYSLQELNRERRRYEIPFENNAKNPEDRFLFKVRKNHRKIPKTNKRRRPNSEPKVLRTTTTSPKVIVTVEKCTEGAQGIEEIQFKTPPTLEKIDFETKPINRNFYFRDEDYKISTYSDIKTPQYKMNDKSVSIGNKQKPADKIETVYARSKVVKYGKPHSAEVLGGSDTANESNLFSTDDKTIVLAKSVPVDYW